MTAKIYTEEYGVKSEIVTEANFSEMLQRYQQIVDPLITSQINNEADYKFQIWFNDYLGQYDLTEADFVELMKEKFPEKFI